MEEKFLDELYDNLLEFACDVRIMILNCYHYNGRLSKVAKLAQKLEMIFEQKLMLLPRDIRETCSMRASLGEVASEERAFVSDTGKRSIWFVIYEIALVLPSFWTCNA